MPSIEQLDVAQWFGEQHGVSEAAIVEWGGHLWALAKTVDGFKVSGWCPLNSRTGRLQATAIATQHVVASLDRIRSHHGERAGKLKPVGAHR